MIVIHTGIATIYNNKDPSVAVGPYDAACCMFQRPLPPACITTQREGIIHEQKWTGE